MGDTEKAAACYLKSAKIVEAKMGKNHPMTATMLNNLATVYWEGKKLKEAEALFLRCLAIDEKAYGKDHLQVSATLDNLSQLYMTMEKYDTAKIHRDRSRKIKQAAREKAEKTESK